MIDSIMLATSNQGKAREFRKLLPGVEILTLAEIPMEMPEEDGETFEEIAVRKAEYVAERLGRVVIADDSGLEVDALGGAPGIRSARYAEGTDADRNQKLLKALEGISDRTARFVCAMALARPGHPSVVTRGTCEGRIALSPQGEEGFGYDPVFELDEPHQTEVPRTMARLSADEKSRVSHRYRAMLAIKPHIDALSS